MTKSGAELATRKPADTRPLAVEAELEANPILKAYVKAKCTVDL